MKISFPKYEDFPEYAIETAKMVKLKNTLQKLITQKNEMSQQNQKHTEAIRLRSENVDKLIEAGKFDDVSTATRHSPDDFTKLSSKIHMTQQAIDKHRVTVDKMKNTVNPKLLKDVKSKYESLVKNISKAHIELSKLYEEEQSIITALENADIRYWGVMPRIHTSNIGTKNNEYAWIHFFLKETESQGYIQAKDYLK